MFAALPKSKVAVQSWHADWRFQNLYRQTNCRTPFSPATQCDHRYLLYFNLNAVFIGIVSGGALNYRVRLQTAALLGRGAEVLERRDCVYVS